jgi:hypothetical protein
MNIKKVKVFEREALFVQVADKCLKENNHQPIEYEQLCLQVKKISEDINYDYETLWLSITSDVFKPLKLTEMEKNFRPYLKAYRAVPISVCYTKSALKHRESYRNTVKRHEQSIKDIHKDSRDWGVMINKMAGDFKKLDNHLALANMEATELKKERESIAEILKSI